MLFKSTSRNKCCGLLAQAAPTLPRSFWADRKGVTSVEYALLASVLAVVFLMGETTVSTALKNSFSTVWQSLEQATAPHANNPDACYQISQENTARQDGKLLYAGAIRCGMPQMPECLPRTARQLP